MTKQMKRRPHFQNIEISEQPRKPASQDPSDRLLDRRLDQKAIEKGIPSLVMPAAEKAEPAVAPPPRAPVKTLNIELPDYLWIELKKSAASQMISLRHLIMTMMRDNGYEIDERDMIEDGRRLRGSRAIPEQILP
jgi:hypothetical protein